MKMVEKKNTMVGREGGREKLEEREKCKRTR